VTQDNIVKLSQPGTFSDPLTEVLRAGARALLAHAVEAEVAGFLGGHADKLTDDGHRRLVRHGHLPEREIMTGIGAVAVCCPRVRDRAANGGERIRFSSAILPPYARRSKSLEVLIPILYLKGISTGDFEEALAALLGKDPSCGLLCIARWSSLKYRGREFGIWQFGFRFSRRSPSSERDLDRNCQRNHRWLHDLHNSGARHPGLL
jgi:hypothetical protein